MNTPSGDEPPYLTEAENQFNTKMKKLSIRPSIDQFK